MDFSQGNDALVDIDFSVQDVAKLVKQLKDNKAPGPDTLEAGFLKGIVDNVSEALYLIFRKSLDTAIVPDSWKLSNVTPIFKKGDKKSMDNYRPVSLNSIAGKMFERLIKTAVEGHLEKFHLIKDNQHGFHKNRSCLTNLLDANEYVAEYLDKGIPVDEFFFDFKKAFDKVPHYRLGLKLISYGIKGKVKDWITEWLSNRRQRVVINGVNSQWVEVLSGVPQGSVLGPVLFSIFLDDIDDKVISKTLKFADDMKMLVALNSQETKNVINQDISYLSLWAKKWQMEFNLSKCKVMHYGRANSNEIFYMEGSLIEASNMEKDLGIYFSEDFKKYDHCNEIAKRCAKISGMIMRTFNNKNSGIMKILYKSLIRPHIDYCSQVWRPSLKKDILIIERIQRRFTKRIEDCKGLSYEERLKKLNLTTIEDRMERADMIEVYRLINHLDDSNYRNYFSIKSTVTRGHNLKIQKKGCITNIGLNTFSNRICNSWNRLPTTVVQAVTLMNFKIEYDKYIMNNGGRL